GPTRGRGAGCLRPRRGAMADLEKGAGLLLLIRRAHRPRRLDKRSALRSSWLACPAWTRKRIECLVEGQRASVSAFGLSCESPGALAIWIPQWWPSCSSVSVHHTVWG